MLFSACFLYCIYAMGSRVPSADRGRFYMLAFTKALERTTNTTRREVQALGRRLLKENLDELKPASLTPLGEMFEDPKGDIKKPVKRPHCCNGNLGSAIGTAFIDAYMELYPEKATKFILDVNSEMKGHEKFNLYKPLGQALTQRISPKAIDEDHADAWMIVKSNREGPLPGVRPRSMRAAPKSEPKPVEEPAPPTLESVREHEIEALVKDVEAKQDIAITQSKPASEKGLTEADIEQILRGIEEDPKKNAKTLHDANLNEPIKVSSVVDVLHPEKTRAAEVSHGSFEDYRHALDNDPAFVALHQHPQLGPLLVIIQVDGVNKLGQTVYRGGAIFDPQRNKMTTHKYISSVIGPIYWTDEAGAKYIVKAIPWTRGLCGKYWTNVDRGKAHDDIEEYKRWFLLTVNKETKQPLLRIWAGASGEANFNAYMNGLRRKLRELRKRDASLPLQHGELH